MSGELSMSQTITDFLGAEAFTARVEPAEGEVGGHLITLAKDGQTITFPADSGIIGALVEFLRYADAAIHR